MGEYVRVESVEALKRFRSALCKFAETVGVGLDEADAETQRTLFWVRQEQHNYWKRQINRRAEQYARAKSELSRKKGQKTVLGGRFSCVDEEKALAAAERRLEQAKQKLANVRRWSRLLDEESFSYKGVSQGMSHAIETDVPNALTALDNMVAAIEAYASSATPDEQRSLAGAAAAPDVARPTDSAAMTRAAAALPDAATEAYQKLRRQTPAQAVRDGAALAKPELDRWEPGAADESVRRALAALDVARRPIGREERIVVARGVGRHARVYLERVESSVAGDSGWYVGFADETEVGGYDALRVADLLAARPALQAVLELPAGHLLVFAGASLEAVVDPRGRLAWCAPATGE